MTRPTPSLRVMTTLHLPVSSDTDGENRVRFWNYAYPEGEDSVRQSYALALAYEPMRFGVGARWEAKAPRPGDFGLELGGQAVLAEWSTYRDRHAERPLDAWHSTVSGTLGAAVDFSGRRIAVDVGFAPSPVPAQDGRTNYVDGSRVSADLAFETRLEILGTRLRACGRAFGQLLLARDEVKSASARHPVIDEVPDGATDVVDDEPIAGSAGLQTNNPGYPGYSSAGWLLGAGLSLDFSDR